MTDKIKVEGQDISIKSFHNDEYISLTDIARRKAGQEPRFVIRTWIRSIKTLQFLGVWETMYNPDFKRVKFDTFKMEVVEDKVDPSPRKFIEYTQAKGIITQSGRYGGTYAHRDIAFEFASWVEPVFKLYLITEFQRLKKQELSSDWSIRRVLAKDRLPNTNQGHRFSYSTKT